jgi:hypothetical protein
MSICHLSFIDCPTGVVIIIFFFHVQLDTNGDGKLSFEFCLNMQIKEEEKPKKK